VTGGPDAGDALGITGAVTDARISGIFGSGDVADMAVSDSSAAALAR